MKNKIGCLLFFLFFITTQSLHAQVIDNRDTLNISVDTVATLDEEIDTIGNEGEVAGQKQIYWQELPEDLSPEENVVRITPEKLPAKVQETLEDDAVYNGWKEGRIYHDKNTGLYKIYIKEGDNVRIYGMNKRGQPITFSVVED